MSEDASLGFENLVYLLNNSPTKESVSEKFRQYLSHDISGENNDKISLASEIVNFLNGVIPLMTDDKEKNKGTIELMLSRLSISNKSVSNAELTEAISEEIEAFKSQKFNSNLVDFDWQISVLDRKSDNVNLTKADKVEIATKFNFFSSKSQKYESSVMKVNYNEFEEILNNFKKIDDQLHLFKQ